MRPCGGARAPGEWRAAGGGRRLGWEAEAEDCGCGAAGCGRAGGGQVGSDVVAGGGGLVVEEDSIRVCILEGVLLPVGPGREGVAGRAGDRWAEFGMQAKNGNDRREFLYVIW